MKIDIYNDDKLQTISELLVSFSLSYVPPDNMLKKPVIKWSPIAKKNIITYVNDAKYLNWRKKAITELMEQGFQPTAEDKLYDQPVMCLVRFRPKKNKNGSACKHRSDIANLNKAIHDLIQFTKSKGFGFFIKDDKQIIAPFPFPAESVPEGRIDCEIWKLKDKNE